MKRILSLTLLFSLIVSSCFSLFACSTVKASEDLMRGITPADDKPYTDIGDDPSKVFDFALELLSGSRKNGKNVLLSPVSIMLSLAMAMNGADGETLSEIENTVGMTREELNLYLSSYLTDISSNYPKSKEKNCIVNFANAIWFRDIEDFSVSRSFLQRNADWYDAAAYSSDFSDGTVKDINAFVKEKTDGMIDEILNNIDPYAMLYLVNTLSFDGIWDEIYKTTNIFEGEFTDNNGEKENAEFMKSFDEDYVKTDGAEGIIKYYSEKEYAFVALLPEENTRIDELLLSLDGEKIKEMFDSTEKNNTISSIPKFTCDYSSELSSVLSELGIKKAFTNEADLSPMTENDIDILRIEKVLHKTHITVDEKGTQAGAASSVEVALKGISTVSHNITFDRPFVYMIIDTNHRLPLFIGTVDSLRK